jgi:hypothetical protein
VAIPDSFDDFDGNAFSFLLKLSKLTTIHLATITNQTVNITFGKKWVSDMITINKFLD